VKNEALFFYIKRKGQKLNSSIADTATVGIERERERGVLFGLRESERNLVAK
jgi:hypothetical protein